MVVRGDLSTGLQLAQACHAAVGLCDHTGTGWLPAHPNLVVLAVTSEAALMFEYRRLEAGGVDPVMFYEPDIDGWTAFAVAPDVRARDLLSGLPLAGKGVVVS